MEKKEDNLFAAGIGNYDLSDDGEKMIVRRDGDFHIVASTGKKADFEDNTVSLTQMEMRLDRRAEYQQIFDQTWRQTRDFFYDANMHGVDWPATKAKYAALLPYAAHRFDLTYILGEMIGELCCSHTYTGGGDVPRITPSKIGLFGCDFEIDAASNKIRIGRIIQGESWDEDLRSPLAEPGLEVSDGDYILAINGVKLTSDINPYSLTENCMGQTVKLTINSKPAMSGSHDITIRPISSESALRYFDWVESNKAYVDSVSEGDIGYIHIPDMGGFGLTRFTKMFYHQMRKPGLIIDVRWNGGGFVSELILKRLRQEVKAMGMSRNTIEDRSPGSGVLAHMVTLTNQFSCSDGDYFPYFFREYELGPLMGKRTWGGVIGIRGGRGHVDGGYCYTPEYGIFDLEGNWVMENVGVIPDREVDNLPDRLLAGYDDQLDAAIDHIKERFISDPKSLPMMPEPPAPR
ncbi:MAG: PDZ domain-containing protein [candidate division Zixibacteria bacterium]